MKPTPSIPVVTGPRSNPFGKLHESRRHPRRDFLACGAVALAGLSVGQRLVAAGAPPRLRAVIIGHTGGGDFGHGYDQIFSGIGEVEVVAVADPDAAGRGKAQGRSGAARAYADYREMLTNEKPALVSVAFRHPRQHPEVALAAIDAGAHLFIEKPLAETLTDADRIEQAAVSRKVKTVVAHNRRYGAEFQQARALVLEDFVGQVREIHIHGKQDARAGGEDMMVLGTHDFDLLRFIFGDPRWCTATVLVRGREATKEDARDGREPIRVLGDTIRAEFGFTNNVSATWQSVSVIDGWNQPKGPREHWSFEILGTKRIIAYQSGVGFAFLNSPYLLHPTNEVKWQPLPAPSQTSPTLPQQMGRDLVQAARAGTATLCSVVDGRWAIEMLTGIYQAHLGRARVTFPLKDRRDPLA